MQKSIFAKTFNFRDKQTLCKSFENCGKFIKQIWFEKWYPVTVESTEEYLETVRLIINDPESKKFACCDAKANSLEGYLFEGKQGSIVVKTKDNFIEEVIRSETPEWRIFLDKIKNVILVKN